MEEYNSKVRSYKFSAQSWDRGTLYVGTIVVQAYDRSEAIAQFKEMRVELNSVPKEIYPLGKECEFTCEPA